MREEIYLLGRILLGLVFLGSGVGHLTKTEPMAQYAAYKKVPSPKLMVQLSGVAMIAGALGIILGVFMDLAALGLAIVVVAAGVLMHKFWEETDDQAKAGEQASFMKNISIAGGLLLLVAFPLDFYTLTDHVF